MSFHMLRARFRDFGQIEGTNGGGIYSERAVAAKDDAFSFPVRERR